MSHNVSTGPIDISTGVALRSLAHHARHRTRRTARAAVRTQWKVTVVVLLATTWAIGADHYRPWWELATAAIVAGGAWAWGWAIERRVEKRLGHLRRWCDRMGIDTPELLGWHETPLGEQFGLRVTGKDDDGKVMTVAKWKALEGVLRDVIGDDCRHVTVSPIRQHGGRINLDVQWRDAEVVEIPVRMTATSTAYARSEAEAARLQAEAAIWWAEHERAELDEPALVLAVTAPAYAPQAPIAHAPISDPVDLPIGSERGAPGEGIGFGPPTTPQINDPRLFAPSVPAPVAPIREAVLRPLNARSGTRTGALWDRLETGDEVTADLLASDVGMVDKSVTNTLRGWESLGLVGRRSVPGGDLWYALCASIPANGLDQESNDRAG